MKRLASGCLRVLFGLFLALALGLVVLSVLPVSPGGGTTAARDLADPDSRFIQLNGLEIHHKVSGSGEPAWILLHGFGASSFSWREVMQPLGSRGAVIAYDRPAFGLSARPLAWNGENPYTLEAQARQLTALMDAYGLERAVLVGNSAGGTVALQAALQYPERVQALILVDAAIYNTGGGPGWLRPVLGWPVFNHLGPWFVRTVFARQGESMIQMAWHDPSRVTPEILAGYRLPLQAGGWDRALWEFTRASRPSGLSDRLGELRVPVLVITGDDDRIVPTEDSLRLAREIPGAQLAVLPGCGHLPQEECPEGFLKAVAAFMSTVEVGNMGRE